MKYIKRHLISTILLVLVSIGILCLPQLSITYDIPYLSSIIETKDLSEGLILHYSFDQELDIHSEENTNQILLDRLEKTLTVEEPSFQLSFDENSLVNLFDQYSFRVNGNPKTVQGRKGEAMSFDGDASLAVEGFNYIPGNFTQAAWIYSENPSWGYSEFDYEGRWITKNVGELGGLFLQDVSGDRSKVGYRLEYNDGTKLTFLPVTIETGKWFHLMASYDDKTAELRIYLNGRLEGIKQLNQSKALKSWKGLKLGGGPGSWFNGRIDQLKIFDKVIQIEQTKKSRIIDSSPFNHSGTIHGDPQLVNGRFGKAMQFDGRVDYVTVESQKIDQAKKNIGISYWYHQNSPPTSTQTPIGKGSRGGIWSGSVLTNSSAKFHFGTEGSTDSDASVSTSYPSPNAWHHVVGVYNYNSSGRLYIDGALVDKDTAVAGILDWQAGTLNIGRHPYGDKYYFKGKIDEIRVYNKALSKTEISILSSGKTSTPYPSSPVLFSSYMIILLIILAIGFSFIEVWTE